MTTVHILKGRLQKRSFDVRYEPPCVVVVVLEVLLLLLVLSGVLLLLLVVPFVGVIEVLGGEPISIYKTKL